MNDRTTTYAGFAADDLHPALHVVADAARQFWAVSELSVFVLAPGQEEPEPRVFPSLVLALVDEVEEHDDGTFSLTVNSTAWTSRASCTKVPHLKLMAGDDGSVQGKRRWTETGRLGSIEQLNGKWSIHHRPLGVRGYRDTYRLAGIALKSGEVVA